MPDNLQLPVAIRQQPRDVWLFLTMQPMVEAEIERTRFAKALNERVAREHPEVRGRPGWLRDRIKSYVKQQKNSRFKAVSEQTCAYWLKGEKIARHANATMLCEALGLTRGDLFGESEDPRLAAIVERWAKLPEHVKNGIHSMVNPEAFQPSEPSQATSAPQRPSLRVARP